MKPLVSGLENFVSVHCLLLSFVVAQDENEIYQT
jgi:hypothetical protein